MVTVVPPNNAAFGRSGYARRHRLTKRAWGWGLWWCRSPVEGLHEDVDGAAAGEADGEGFVVGVPEGAHLGLARLEDLKRLGEHGTFNATAGHRPGHLTVLV